MNNTNVAQLETSYGRRSSDRWLGQLLNHVFMNTQQKPIQFQLTNGKKERRPRRTKIQMRSAMKRAMAIVEGEHPEWTAKRQHNKAVVLVRRYIVV